MLHVVGLGVQETVVLEQSAQRALVEASLVIGSPRQLQTVAHLINEGQETLVLPKLSELQTLLQKRIDATQTDTADSVCLLASGDPLFYGIGKWVAKHFQTAVESGRVVFHPAVSSIQAACHRLAWSLQDVQVLSLHGRPVQKLARHLQPNARLLILTDKQSQPNVLADYCVRAGFPASKITVLEQLGYQEERISHYQAEQLSSQNQISFNALHVTAIEVKGVSPLRPRFPGFDDHLFVTDKEPGKGMFTKREVRLAILSMLSPQAGDCLWDIGAGCGGVAIESAYWASEAEIHSIEHHPDRLRCLQDNAARFGVADNLSIVEGRAPGVLTNTENPLPVPNKIFIGGSDGELWDLLALCWKTLDEQGLLVASAVTESTRAILFRFLQQRTTAQDAEVSIHEISVRRSDRLAGEVLMRPQLPVQLFSFVKKTQQAERPAVESQAGDNA